MTIHHQTFDYTPPGEDPMRGWDIDVNLITQSGAVQVLPAGYLEATTHDPDLWSKAPECRLSVQDAWPILDTILGGWVSPGATVSTIAPASADMDGFYFLFSDSSGPASVMDEIRVRRIQEMKRLRTSFHLELTWSDDDEGDEVVAAAVAIDQAFEDAVGRFRPGGQQPRGGYYGVWLTGEDPAVDAPIFVGTKEHAEVWADGWNASGPEVRATTTGPLPQEG